MSDQIRFTFALSGAQQNEQLNVLRFEGDEGISRLYEFNIELLSANADLDIDSILQQPASLTLTQGDDSRVIQGIVSRFDAVRQVNNQVLYKARLVPRLWELSLYHTNEVYLEMTVPEIIEQVLAEAGFESVDYDLSDLQGDYKKWPYKCQYGETHLDFISRLMERDGIYYYFTSGDAGEKIIFCDDLNMQADLPNAAVEYSAAESLEINSRANVVYSFVTQQQRLPHKVLLKDYNDDSPSVDIMGEAIIDDSASKSSEIYVWGQNIETVEEGERLAEMRAEQFRAGKLMFHGESAVNRLVPGFFFKLDGHFRKVCNRDYCLLALHHEGSDKRLLESSKSDGGVAYFNELTAIPADVQYRPALETHRPEIHGVLNAYIDAEGDGQYAEIDEEGRYRVLLPFDRVDRDGGKASHWVRMSQPFAGERQGMHFPLRKGTEVLLTFVGGDPDRPVISGSLPNASAPSIVNSQNHTNSMIQTQAGNKIEIEDKDGKNRIKFETPQNGSYMHLGAPNHPGDGWVVVTDGIERKSISGGQQTTVVTNGLAEFGATATNINLTRTAATEGEATLGLGYNTTARTEDPTSIFEFKVRKTYTADTTKTADENLLAMATDVGKEGSYVFTVDGDSTTVTTLTNAAELTGDFIINRVNGTRYSWADGIEFNYGQGLIYNFGNSHEITHWNQADTSGAAGMVKTMFERTVGGIKQYTADGNNPSGSWQYMLSKGEVEIKQTDTFIAQNGNIYDFGGYWNYNLGNSYEENHIDQSATVNSKGPHDRAPSGGPDFSGTINGEKVSGLTAGKTWISKSFGDSYDYKKGDGIEVTVGDTDSYTYGNTYDYHDGNAKDLTTGNTHSTYHGRVDEFFMGGTSHFGLGGNFDMQLAANLSIMAGTATDISLINSNSVFIGIKGEIALGWKYTIDTAAEMNSSVMNVEAEINKLKSSTTDIQNNLTCIGTQLTNIDNNLLYIEKATTHLQTAVVTLMA